MGSEFDDIAVGLAEVVVEVVGMESEIVEIAIGLVEVVVEFVNLNRYLCAS